MLELSRRGDFNEILSPLEQRGGEFSRSKAERFAATMDNCNLVDLDFFGGKFTWQKRCRGGSLISPRLDRGMGVLSLADAVSRGHS